LSSFFHVRCFEVVLVTDIDLTNNLCTEGVVSVPMLIPHSAGLDDHTMLLPVAGFLADITPEAHDVASSVTMIGG
jgi:hypothetical protein